MTSSIPEWFPEFYVAGTAVALCYFYIRIFHPITESGKKRHAKIQREAQRELSDDALEVAPMVLPFLTLLLAFLWPITLPITFARQIYKSIFVKDEE